MSQNNHVGRSTICVNNIPNQARIKKLAKNNISRDAQFRLSVIDFHINKAERNVNLTCRRFMISRSFVYKWLSRYSPRCLKTMECRSRRPKHTRSVTYGYELVSCIRKLRQDNPTYSAKKLVHILGRDFKQLQQVSAATIGRIIKRWNLFFARNLAKHKRRLRGNLKRWQKMRKPYGLKALSPHQLVEFDMKHIYSSEANKPQYAFCAIDPYTKETLIHVAGTPSSANARVAMEKVIARFGKDITVVCDNGSENLGKVYGLLQEQDVVQLFTRPYEPKDKPYIENFIGKYQAECLDESVGEIMSIEERQAEASAWLDKWHNYRPHQALNYATPAEFCATIGLAIRDGSLSTMY